MINIAYYGGMLAIAFGIWIWVTSGYGGCDFRVGDCGIFEVLKISALQGMGRNFLALAIMAGGWKSMRWAAKQT